MSDSDSASESGRSGEKGEHGTDTLFVRIGGEPAVSSVVEEFYDILQQDERVAQFFSSIDVQSLIQHQKEFLMYAFGGKSEHDGPPLGTVHSALGLTDDHFDAMVDDLAKVLETLGVGEELKKDVMDVMAGLKPEVMGTSGKTASNGVTVVYDLEQEHCELVRKHLEWVVEAVGTLEEVGIAIYDAIVINAGEGKKLFVSPKRATAFRFISQVQRYVQGSDDTQYLDEELYNMSMRHIAYITPAQCKQYMPLFIGTIVSVIKGVLDEEWDEFGNESWLKLLNYIGGMLIRNLSEFTGKVHLVRKSWGVITNVNTIGKGSNQSKGDDEADEGEVDVADSALSKNKNAVTGSVNFGESLHFNLGVMSPEIAAMFKRPKEVLAPLFGVGFGSITELISDPNLLNEELYILGIRHLKYGTRAEFFPVFGQAVMVTLRSMLPRDWNWAHEDAWGWLWETCSTYLAATIEQGHINKHLIDETMDRAAGQDLANLGHICHTRLFQLSDDVQNFFYKPNTMVAYILEKVLELLSSLCHEPVAVSHSIRALGMRHIKYNIPPIHFPLLGKSLAYTFSTVLEGFWTDEIEKSWMSVFDFVCRCMTRAVNEGSNLVTKAMVNNSVDEMSEVLKQAPRGMRDMWLLEVNVSGEILSPFYWALYDGKIKLAHFMLEDLLAIRADRETYYSGSENLFLSHPGLVKNLAVLSPSLLSVLFDGLMWRSRITDNGFRRVNYFIRDVYGDPTNQRYLDPYHTPLAELGRLHYAELFVHPLSQFIIDVKWSRFARTMFIQAQLYFLLLLIIFMIGYVGFNYKQGKGSASYDGAYVARWLVAIINLLILLLRQVPRVVQEMQRNQTASVSIGVCIIHIPISLLKVTNAVRLTINILLVFAFFFDKEIINVGIDDKTAATIVSWCTSIVVALLWLLMFDWFSLEINLAQFKVRMNGVITDFFVVLLFGSCLFVGFACSMALSNLDSEQVDVSTNTQFARADEGVAYLFAAFTGNYNFDPNKFTGQMQFFFVLFSIFSVLFLTNLMSALFTTTTFLLNKDVEGLTYLDRAQEIVELESMCTIEKRHDIWFAMKFDQRIEFDEGDLGLNGGLQVSEPLCKHNGGKQVDRIQRFPGEASPKLPWPVDKGMAKTVDEKLVGLDSTYIRILKTLRDMSKKKGHGTSGHSQEYSEMPKEDASASEVSIKD
eukprot:GEMP01002897.1.p1 GENE.GEMP01002897.1~~GEMP01002897.1.p1  ORF type:complete len:1183 (+),score=249.82 GEMP01002897.1:779-4327(+)